MISWEIDIIASISGVIALGWFYYRYFLKPRNELINRALGSRVKIDKIYAELFPNHGSTLRDAVDRVEKTVVLVSQKQHTILLEAEEGYFETDAHGYCTGVNRTYCHLVGRTESEILGTGWIYNIHPEDRPKVFQEWNACVEGSRDFRLNYRMLNSNGTEIKVFGQANPLVNPYTKELLGYFGTIKQIK